MTMPYTPMYWGDYLRATMLLRNAQHGVYIKLLAHYNTTGRALTANKALLYFLCRDESPDAVQADVDYILENYFELLEDGYHNRKADEILAEQAKTSEKRRSAINTRWERERAKKNHTNELQKNNKPEPEPEPEKTLHEKKPRADDSSSDKKPKDSRHHPVEQHIKDCYLRANGKAMTWVGREARILSQFLKSHNPADWPTDEINRAIDYRFASLSVNKADPLHMWLHRLDSYQHGPLNGYGKPLNDPRQTASFDGSTTPRDEFKQRVAAAIEKAKAQGYDLENGHHFDETVRELRGKLSPADFDQFIAPLRPGYRNREGEMIWYAPSQEIASAVNERFLDILKETARKHYIDYVKVVVA